MVQRCDVAKSSLIVALRGQSKRTFEEFVKLVLQQTQRAFCVPDFRMVDIRCLELIETFLSFFKDHVRMLRQTDKLMDELKHWS